MKKITDITVLENYKIHVKYNDGLEGEIHLNHLMDKEEYAFAKNYEDFSKLKIHPKTSDLFWENYNTEHLCKNAIRSQIELRNLAKRLKLVVD